MTDVQLLIASYLEIAEKLPLKSEDLLYLSVDLTNLSKECRERGERFDVQSFVKSLQIKLNKGTIVVPAFTEYLESGMVFDPDKNRPDSGAFSGLVWKMEDFKRTIDPMHSVMVWGDKTEEIMKLNSTDAYGEGSIFDYLFLNNAKAIIIDSHIQDAFPFVHYVEQKMKVNYRRMCTKNFYLREVDAESQFKFNYFRKKRWVLNDFYELQEAMSKEGVKLNYKFGASKLQLIDFREAHDFIKNYINSGKRLYQIDLIHFVMRLLTKPFRLLKKRS